MLGSTWSEAFQRGGQDGKEATHSGADQHCTAGREAEVGLARGTSVKLISRELGITEQTYYRWRREYGGMKVSQARRLKEREREDGRLKRAVADLTLDKLILEEAAKGNNRKLAREGGDPLAEKRRRQGVPSFAEATARVVEQKQAGWRRRAHGREWILTFERYAFPRIGKMPVSEVTSADVLEILAPIWHTKADTARRLRQRIRAVLEWAVAMEFRIDNPCDRIDPVLGPQRDVVQHMRALPHREVAAAIQTARASTVPLAVRLAFEFLVLTAARWGEVRWAEWTEIDRDEGVWTVPARRTKANREHRVPLCGRALEILDGAQTLVKGTSPICFPIGSASSLRRSNCAGCSGSTRSRPCPTGFAPASAIGRPRRRIIGYLR